MKVSVVIPVFNRFDLVEKSIQSVLNQNYTEYEIIVVDDCSTDGIFSCTHEKLSVYRVNENSGPGYCRQFGVEKSRGDYLLFLDSDDILDEHFLKLSILKHIELENSICFTYCHSGVVNSDKTWNKTDREYDSIFPALLEGRQWPTSSILWNKKYLPKWNNYRIWEDYDIEFRASLRCNKIGYISKKVVFISPPSENSLSGRKKIFSEIENHRNVLKFLTDNKLEFNKLLELNQINTVWNNVKLRKLKLIRDSIELNFGISDDLFSEVATNKIELIILNLLNTIGVQFLKLYIKFKIRNFNSGVDQLYE